LIHLSTVEDIPSAIEDVEVLDTPNKIIINGQMIIIKDGVKFNTMGQMIK
jgi:hypothetical protein